jgi:hypothetical protein
MSAENLPTVILTSGQTLRLTRIRLYELEAVQEIISLRSQAAKALGAKSGLGVLGEPGWGFLASAVALSAVSALLAGQAAKHGGDLLAAAHTKSAALKSGGVYFDAYQLVGIDRPDPGIWSVATPHLRYIDVTSDSDLTYQLRLHQKTRNDIVQYKGVRCLKLETTRSYIHDGDDFIAAEAERGEALHFRWSHVVAFYAAPLPTHEMS